MGTKAHLPTGLPGAKRPRMGGLLRSLLAPLQCHLIGKPREAFLHCFPQKAMKCAHDRGFEGVLLKTLKAHLGFVSSGTDFGTEPGTFCVPNM